MFTTRFQAFIRRNAQRLAGVIGRLPITPNQVTVTGMVITFIAAVLTGFGNLLAAAIVLAFAGTFDILDGALARATKRMYPYGAFLDSTTDRFSEAAIYVGLAAFFLYQAPPAWWTRLTAVGCLVALAGSMLVSYVRARAQSLGFTCETGIFARPERVVVTILGLLLGLIVGPEVLALVVALLAVVTTFTAIQRVNEVWQQARAQRRPRGEEKAGQPGSAGERSAP
ncbi:MAG TPA: CDP-alcohol phosphatidyltransferase family protein [Candidatus Dormibacteraeota bacterium]|nr:CDP-alcohol phosphatidyltransferase family protein [Candidatus Dormibacteraeota bacterium]